MADIVLSKVDDRTIMVRQIVPDGYLFLGYSDISNFRENDVIHDNLIFGDGEVKVNLVLAEDE